MNRRLKQLAKQAMPEGVIGLRSEYHDIWLNNFSQLIVQECAKIPHWCIDTDRETQNIETDMAQKVSKKIKEHFGVKDELKN